MCRTADDFVTIILVASDITTAANTFRFRFSFVVTFLVSSMFSIQRRQSKSLQKELDGNEYMRWEHDHDLEDLPELPLFDDYLEMGENKRKPHHMFD